MKLSSLLVWSLVGMGGTSASVAWMTPSSPAEAVVDASGPTAAGREEQADEASAAAVAAPEGAPSADGPQATFLAEGTLRVEGRLGHATLPASRAHESFVLLQVGARSGQQAQTRAPVNVSIVVDRSGSMKGDRLRNAIAAARGMFDRLRDDDTVSLVAYDGEARLLLPTTPVRRLDRRGFERALRGLRGGGNTCISCGLNLGLAQLRRHHRGTNRILLLSDGQANRGLTRPDELARLGDLARQQRVSIASIGVDLDYDERTMFAVSEASNGNHYFVEDPAGLTRVFEQERRGLLDTVADRADVSVTLAEGVELLEVIDRPHRRDGERISLALGSFAAGEDKTVLLRVRVPEGHGEHHIADVQVAYLDLTTDREQRLEGALALHHDEDRRDPPRLDAAVEARLGRKDVFDALVAANEAFTRGDVAVAERRLEQARGRVSSRRTRTAPTASSALDRDFNQQLAALSSAASGFREADRSGPPAKKSRRKKKATRKNFMTADPFSN